MAKLAKKALFEAPGARKETQMDKTTRIVRRISDDEAEVRHAKTARLRNARFANEADSAVDTVARISSRVRNRR